MPARNPDFAALAETAYKAADKLIEHAQGCPLCVWGFCAEAFARIKDYRIKKDKALKAIRGRKK